MNVSEGLQEHEVHLCAGWHLTYRGVALQSISLMQGYSVWGQKPPGSAVQQKHFVDWQYYHLIFSNKLFVIMH